MKVLEHGNFYQENRIAECICGCKFEYDHGDIRTDTSYSYTTYPNLYSRYVICPECDARIYIGTTFKNGTVKKYGEE